MALTHQSAIMQAQQAATDAIAREKAAQAELNSTKKELCSLQGKLDMTIKKSKTSTESVHSQYRPKIQNLEAQVQQLTKALEDEVSRNRKRTVPKFEL